MDLLKAMAGAGPLGVREIARLVERDVKGVHTDLTALCKTGIVERVDDAKYQFPYDALHIDFTVIGSKAARSEEHTSELQSLMRISYAVFCLKKKKHNTAISTYIVIKTNT